MSNTRVRTSNGGLLGKIAAAAINPYLLVKRGASDEHATIIASASDIPIGVTVDGADAAGDALAVAILGKGETKPVKLAASPGTVNAGTLLISAGDGTAKALPVTPGTYQVIGRALDAGTGGQVIQVADCAPYDLIVPDALTVHGQVVVSDGDGTAGYLEDKLVAGTNVTLTADNAEDETLTVAAADPTVKVSANDTTPGVLNGKLVGGDGISLAEGTDGGNETLTVAWNPTAALNSLNALTFSATVTQAEAEALRDAIEALFVGHGLMEEAAGSGSGS